MSIVSPIHTSYSNLSNEELLNAIDSIRHLSPMIQELCIRLEYYDDEEYECSAKAISPDNEFYKASCPVCAADLSMKLNELGTNMVIYTKEIK